MEGLDEKNIYFILLILPISCFAFTSCNSNHINQTTEANNIIDSLIIALENNDETAIKDLFALEVQNHPEKLYNKSEDFDTQIKKMIDYFEGDVISYEKASVLAEGEQVENGEIVYLRIGNARCDNLVTSKDTYIISFSAILVDDEQENEGIWRIWLGKNDNDYMIVGISEMPLS